MKSIRPFLVRLRFSMQMALHGVLANPLRSLLTVLGVTIGVAAVVSLMGIGEGARLAVMKQFESLGANVIMVESNSTDTNFNPDLAYSLTERVDPLLGMTPYYEINVEIGWRRDKANVDLVGVNSYFPAIRDHALADGVFFSELQVENNAKVAIIGSTLAVQMLGGRTPVGEVITIGGLEYKIIGVLEEKGEGQADGIDNKILIPYTTALTVSGEKTVPTLIGKADSTDEADLAVVQLSRIFKNQNVISETTSSTSLGGNTNTITVTNMDQMVKQADEANQIMTMLLGGIAAVSLLVGGLGIMNIMLVAVSERTGEIGVRRALGARQSDLIIQFLLESLYLSIAGAILGVILGLVSMNIFANYGFDTAVSMTAIQVAVSVSIACGIIFGVYPSINASSVPPVEALRSN